MLASIALIKSSRFQSDHKPGGGPPAFVTNISGESHSLNNLSLPSSVVTSPTTLMTLEDDIDRIESAAAAKDSEERELIMTFTPSKAKALAHPKPKPFDDAHTIAHLPPIPNSIFLSSFPKRHICKLTH